MESMFEWDEAKDHANLAKHGVSFKEAQHAFLDPRRILVPDLDPSVDEQRYFCFGQVGSEVMTVRFTWRAEKVRIIGTGYWRKGRTVYDQENS